MTDRLSFVVPVLNAMAYLPVTVPALRRAVLESPGTEVIVIDNGSTDGSWEWLEREALGWALLERHPGVNVGEVRNLGARRATASVVAFIDADCLVPADYAVRAREALKQSGASGTGCRYDLPANPHWIERTWHDLHDRLVTGEVPYINSGNLVVRREAFERLGGFDPSLPSGEDAELGQRFARAGMPLWQDPQVRVEHLGNPKSLSSFFRKQRWHAQGMFGTVDLRSVDRPTAMTFLFLACVLLSGTQMALAPSVVAAALWAGLPVVVPAAAVGFRMLQGGRARAPGRAVLLYCVYFAARAVALMDILRGGALSLRRRGRPQMPGTGGEGPGTKDGVAWR